MRAHFLNLQSVAFRTTITLIPPAIACGLYQGEYLIAVEPDTYTIMIVIVWWEATALFILVIYLVLRFRARISITTGLTRILLALLLLAYASNLALMTYEFLEGITEKLVPFSTWFPMMLLSILMLVDTVWQMQKLK
ncbi:MAG: hypothetical protein ACFFAY_00480 [Promethearchaeota archaeon]